MTMQENKFIGLDLQTDDPIGFFGKWLADAEAAEPSYANAVTLTTAAKNGRPSARTVLLRDHGENGFVFYTNFESRKGQELLENPQAMMLFYWKSLMRQVRIEGPVTPVDEATADGYFAGRPRESRIGAWASFQSQPMDSRDTFEKRLKEFTEKFEGQDIPRPPHWSGFCLMPDKIEFWNEQQFRLHERIVYSRTKDSWDGGQLLFP